MNKVINECLNSNRDKMLKDLSEFISIDSVSEDHEKVVKALHFILDLADSMGFKAQSFLGDQVGVIEMGEGDETLGVLAHVDVVPPGEISDWKTNPFKTEIIDGKIYGRGTLDDKGMVIATLYAMKAVMDLKLPMKKKVQLILGTQEEVDWVDMDAYVKEYPLPDYGFSPDGEYPICNIEKGVSDIKLEFDVTDTGLNGDDTRPYITSLECGKASNIVPGKATVILSDGSKVEAAGKAVHSCQPEKGDNALFHLADKLKNMDLRENELYKLIEGITYGFRSLFGKELGLYSDSEYHLGEFVHRNAFCPTMINSNGNTVKANINVRFAYGTDEKDIIKGIDKFIEKYKGRLIYDDTLPAVFVSKEKPFLTICANAYEEETGLKNEFTLAYGGSYAKAMPNVVSWGPIFLGEEDTCHEPNEYIAIDSLMASARIFANTIHDIVLSEKSFK